MKVHKLEMYIMHFKHDFYIYLGEKVYTHWYICSNSKPIVQIGRNQNVKYVGNGQFTLYVP